MIFWISANIGTIIVVLLVAAVVALAVWSMVRDKRKGKSSCGCGCSGCPMSGKCHPTADADQAE